jgi:hypothetical protein
MALMAFAMAACAGSTRPENAATETTLRVTLNTVTSPEICEETFTDLDGGEFVWRVTVTWPDDSQDLLYETAGFPSPAGFETLRKDVHLTINRTIFRTVLVEPGSSLTFGVGVSEVDFDIFGGNPRADVRMDRADAYVNVVYDESGWPEGSSALRVNPVSGCAFDAYFTVTVIR